MPNTYSNQAVLNSLKPDYASDFNTPINLPAPNVAMNLGGGGVAGGGGGGGTANMAMGAVNTGANSAASILSALGQGGAGATPLGWAQFGLGAAGQIASMFGNKGPSDLERAQQYLLEAQRRREEMRMSQVGERNPVVNALLGIGGGNAGTMSVADRYGGVRTATTEALDLLRQAAGRVPGSASLSDIMKETSPLAANLVNASRAANEPMRREALRRITEGAPSSISQQAAISEAASQSLQDTLAEAQINQQLVGAAESRRAGAVNEAGAIAGVGQAMPGTAAYGVNAELQALLQSLGSNYA